MVDFLGNELKPGDEIAYIEFSKTSSNFQKGFVERLTEHYVVLNTGARKLYQKVIKINKETLNEN